MQRFDKQKQVNLITGAAQATIPLPNLQSGALQVPLSLNYSFSGLKVVQPVDLVGLGWSLQAGGAITRRVMGKLDEESGPYGPYNSDTVAANYNNGFFIRNAFNGVVDTSPDIYDFSVDGYQGRFIVRDTKVVLLPRQPLQFRYLANGAGFELATEKGVRYLFTTGEQTSPHQNNFGRITTYVSTWHLTRIISAGNTDTIQFHYSNWNYLEQGRAGQTSLQVLNTLNATFVNYLDQAPHTSYVYGSRIQAKVLDSISTHGARLLIRRDRDHVIQQIVKVNVLAGQRRAVQTINLGHSLFQGLSQEPKQRLRLDWVQEHNGLQHLPAYRFAYDSIIAVPPTTSTGQDHWGYYNGHDNNGRATTGALDPSLSALLPFDRLGSASPNREPDFTYTKAGALLRITYPTGGTTDFTYEPNRYAITKQFRTYTYPIIKDVYNTNFQHPDASRLWPASYSHLGSINGDSIVFTLTKLTSVKLVVTALPDSSLADKRNYVDKRDDLLLVKLGTAIDSVILTAKGPITPAERTIDLPPGRYAAWGLCQAMRHQGEPEESVNIAVYLPYTQYVPDVAGNGIRVQQTVTTTNNAPPLVRSYVYEQSTAQGTYSSGILQSVDDDGRPIYRLDPYVVFQYGSDDIKGYWNLTSDNTKFGDEYSKYTFYYACVTEQQGGLGVPAGKTVYYHQSYPAQFNEVLLMREATYRADATAVGGFRPVQLEEFHYLSDSTQAPAFAVARTYRNTYSGGKPIAQEEKSYTMMFAPPVQAYFIARDSTITTRYSTDATSLPITTYTSMAYRQQRPVRSSTWNSQGLQQLHTYSYLSDYAPTLPRFAQLRAANFNPIVETQHWVYPAGQPTALLVGGEATLYDPKWQQPATIWQLELGHPQTGLNAQQINNGHYAAFLSDTRYRRVATAYYDQTTGNPVGQRPTAGTPSASIWGYQQTAVIAQVQQAQPAEVAYTGFEAGDLGRWQGQRTGIKAPGATGTVGYDLAAGLACHSLPPGNYQVSCRVRGTGGIPQANGVTLQAVGNAIAGWTTYMTKMTIGASGTVQVTGNCLIDDVRLHPVNAQMTTYTHDPLVGMTSQTGPDGRTQTYEYDSLGRLIRTRDEQGRILGQQQYHYAGQ